MPVVAVVGSRWRRFVVIMMIVIMLRVGMGGGLLDHSGAASGKGQHRNAGQK